MLRLSVEPCNNFSIVFFADVPGDRRQVLFAEGVDWLRTRWADGFVQYAPALRCLVEEPVMLAPMQHSVKVSLVLYWCHFMKSSSQCCSSFLLKFGHLFSEFMVHQSTHSPPHK